MTERWTVLMVHADGQHSSIVFNDDTGVRESKARAENLAAEKSMEPGINAAMVFRGGVVVEYVSGTANLLTGVKA